MGRLTDFRARTIAALNSGASGGGWAGVTDRMNDARANAMPATLAGRGDGATMLPSAAQVKLAALQEQRDELRAVVLALTSRVEEARLAKHEAERELRRVQANDAPANQLPDDDQQVLRARAKVERATVDFARLNERLEARTSVWQGLAAIIERAERWLASLPSGTTLELVATASSGRDLCARWG